MRISFDLDDGFAVVVVSPQDRDWTEKVRTAVTELEEKLGGGRHKLPRPHSSAEAGSH
jgi:hypothetical protein